MNVIGVDAHTTYQVLVVVNSRGRVVEGPVRVETEDVGGLLELLERWRPLELVVETAPTWPWL